MAACRKISALDAKPHFQRGDGRRRGIAPNAQPLFGARAVDATLDVKGRVDAFHGFQRNGCENGGAFLEPVWFLKRWVSGAGLSAVSPNESLGVAKSSWRLKMWRDVRLEKRSPPWSMPLALSRSCDASRCEIPNVLKNQTGSES